MHCLNYLTLHNKLNGSIAILIIRLDFKYSFTTIKPSYPTSAYLTPRNNRPQHIWLLWITELVNRAYFPLKSVIQLCTYSLKIVCNSTLPSPLHGAWISIRADKMIALFTAYIFRFSALCCSWTWILWSQQPHSDAWRDHYLPLSQLIIRCSAHTAAAMVGPLWRRKLLRLLIDTLQLSWPVYFITVFVSYSCFSTHKNVLFEFISSSLSISEYPTVIRSHERRILGVQLGFKNYSTMFYWLFTNL